MLDLPDVEVDEAHRQHVVGEEGEPVFAVRVVRLESIPQELDVFLLLRRLEGERQVVGEFGGFFQGLTPHLRGSAVEEVHFQLSLCSARNSHRLGAPDDSLICI